MLRPGPPRPFPLKSRIDSFSACVLDPDWSPPGRPPQDWAQTLSAMTPPADVLLAWALCMAPRAVLRLPAEACLQGLAEKPRRELRSRSWRFKFMFCGQWP